jgi:protein-disulfide isomerase
MPRSALLSALVFVLAFSGLAYVLASGPEQMPEFSYARYFGESAQAAPVRIAVIEDLRCPGCRKSHVEVLPRALSELADEVQPELVHITYPVARSDSLELAVLAQTYARYHERPGAEVSALLFEADAPRLSLKQAEDLLLKRYGAVDPDERKAIEDAAEKQLREDASYLRSLGIASVPTVIVNGVVLHAPRAEVLIEHIRSAQPGTQVAIDAPAGAD